MSARHGTQKSVESSCCLFHVSRLLHCPLKSNRQRQSPRRYEYSTPFPEITPTRKYPLSPKGMRIDTSRGRLPLLSSRFQPRCLQDFDTSRTERFVYAFLCNDPLSHLKAVLPSLKKFSFLAFCCRPLCQVQSILTLLSSIRRGCLFACVP